MSIITHLIAETFGTHLGKYNERLKLTQKKLVLTQAPLMHLEAVHILSSGISISSDVIDACCQRGIPIFFLDGLGRPYANLYAAGLGATVITRREQLRAYDDERGVHVAVQFAQGKLYNQAHTLLYLAKLRRDTPLAAPLMQAATEIQSLQGRLSTLEGQIHPLDDLRNTLMGIEGSAAQRYWAAVRQVLPQSYAWTQRETQGAHDPINSLLNYGYGILYSQIERALVLAGLDPYCGFIHVDRPGKPTLTFDLIEEFRQIAVDRVVFGLANRHFKVGQDEHGQLTDDTRRTFAEHILGHLDTPVRYRSERHPLRHVIQSQARLLARYLRRDVTAYIPYLAGG